MSTTASGSGPSNSVDERQPLLESRTTKSHVDIQPDPEVAVTADEPDDAHVVAKKADFWSILWYLVLATFGGVIIAGIIKGLVENGDVEFDFKKALMRALGGGLSGAAAMVLQVLTLMPLRTTMNYQYRYGTTTTEAIETLYADGGYVRYYQGLSAALIQGPVARFGDTAANAGILALLESNTFTKQLPSAIKTLFASLCAAGFRIILTPIDTVKTTLQTEGKPGLKLLKNRIKKYGITSLWFGALATAAASFVGHYPWFATYNSLQELLPKQDSQGLELLRQAFIGFCATLVSDIISNSLRVIKTYRQVHEGEIEYLAAAREIVAVDGLSGLFGRGLKTRIIANGCQGVMFSVLWKLFMDLWNENTKS
ncbi:mitochondrial carrier [Thelephora terrestris]|uniref:Mitochondrial carrier n=1 Tax=Thelephora terrestris TaxID=56493 RepID=A0A9P6L9V7_9AGAM|nr:mitochondrial carrier [Thelephora terrestris]